jgi:hypothetical protein
MLRRRRVTAERYTVVLTGFLSSRKPGEYLYSP